MWNLVLSNEIEIKRTCFLVYEPILFISSLSVFCVNTRWDSGHWALPSVRITTSLEFHHSELNSVCVCVMGSQAQ